MLLDQNFLVSLILKLSILNHLLMKTIVFVSIFLDIKISFYAFKLLASKLGTC